MDNFMLLFVFITSKDVVILALVTWPQTMALPSVQTERPIDGAMIRTLLHLYAEVTSFRWQGYQVWNYCTKIVLVTDFVLLLAWSGCSSKKTEKSVREHESHSEEMCCFWWTEVNWQQQADNNLSYTLSLRNNLKSLKWGKKAYIF